MQTVIFTAIPAIPQLNTYWNGQRRVFIEQDNPYEVEDGFAEQLLKNCGHVIKAGGVVKKRQEEKAKVEKKQTEAEKKRLEVIKRKNDVTQLKKKCRERGIKYGRKPSKDKMIALLDIYDQQQAEKVLVEGKPAGSGLPEGEMLKEGELPAGSPLKPANKEEVIEAENDKLRADAKAKEAGDEAKTP